MVQTRKKIYEHTYTCTCIIIIINETPFLFKNIMYFMLFFFSNEIRFTLKSILIFIKNYL